MNLIMSKLKAIGPASMLTAAFVGPGTITTTTYAGVNFQYALLWSVIFSILATITLQGMTARLGVIGQIDFSSALLKVFSNPMSSFITKLLVLLAIGGGCFAYEIGNLTGATIGFVGISSLSHSLSAFIVGLLTIFLLLTGGHRFLEKLLITLVVIMSLTFIGTMLVVSPDWSSVIKGSLVPRIPDGSIFTIIALVGTTIIPFNLFLHASTVKERWSKKEELVEANFDVWFSILIGGVITMSIIITSGTLLFGQDNVSSAEDFYLQLVPILGDNAKIISSVGLFAAGLSSSIAAPLAAGITVGGILGWQLNMTDKRFKVLVLSVVLFGTIMSALGLRPTPIIIATQAINGLFLPFIIIALVVVMNQKSILGNYVNSVRQNVLAILVSIIAIGLGSFSLYKAYMAMLNFLS